MKIRRFSIFTDADRIRVGSNSVVGFTTEESRLSLPNFGAFEINIMAPWRETIYVQSHRRFAFNLGSAPAETNKRDAPPRWVITEKYQTMKKLICVKQLSIEKICYFICYVCIFFLHRYVVFFFFSFRHM